MILNFIFSVILRNGLFKIFIWLNVGSGECLTLQLVVIWLIIFLFLFPYQYLILNSRFFETLRHILFDSFGSYSYFSRIVFASA